jgi:hypothetical protein
VLLAGALVAVGWAGGDLLSGTAQPLQLLLAVALLGVSFASGSGVAGRRRWAWWASVSLVVVGLIFFLPLTGTVLMGGGLGTIGSIPEAGFMIGVTGLLAATGILLLSCHDLMKDGVSGDDASPPADTP